TRGPPSFSLSSRLGAGVARQLAAAGDALGEHAADRFLRRAWAGVLDHVARQAVGAVDLEVGRAAGGLPDQALVLHRAGALAEGLQVGGQGGGGAALVERAAVAGDQRM